MKIDKRIKAIPWPEPWECKNDRQALHVGVAQAVMGGHRVLVVTVRRNQLHQIAPWTAVAVGADFRLVCCKAKGAEDVGYITERDKVATRKTLDEAIRGWQTSAAYCYPEISERDEAILCRWLGVTPAKKQDASYNHGLVMLNEWTAEAIKTAKERESREKGDFVDDDVDLCPEELPEGLTDYIRRVILPEDDVLIYKKGNVRGTCYLCGRQVKARPGQRFVQYGIADCPSCGQRVRTFLDGGAAFAAENLENVAAIQLGTDGVTLFIRQWRILRPDDPATLREDPASCMKEVARYAVRGKYAAKWQKEAKEAYYMRAYRYDLREWVRVKNPANIYDGGYYFFIPENWRDIVATTSLKYIDLAGYEARRENAKKLKKEAAYGQNMIRFILDWARYPAIELFWKAGYTDLVAAKAVGALTRETRNVIRWSAKSIKEALHFPIRLLREKAPNDWAIEELKRMTDLWDLVNEGTIAERDIPTVEACKVNHKNIYVALRHSTAYRVVKYINGQYDREKEEQARLAAEAKKKKEYFHRRDPVHVGDTYRDYLGDCVALNLNLDDRSVLFPPDLPAAHQRTIEMLRYREIKAKTKNFKKAVEKLLPMAWEQAGLLIRPAATAKELIREGAALHHCVGGYAERMAKGETAIFFIRRAEEPDKPFYTLELRDKTVIQCRTAHNKSYEQDEPVHAFVREWLATKVLKTKKKPTKAKKAA